MTTFEYGNMPSILCCMCGIEIQNNPANMCVTCLRNQVDITDDLKTELTIHSCRSCQRFLCPPWQAIALESKELMSVCLKKIPGLSKLKLIDAVWIWTEPHSMRLKIKITVQKEVMNGAILQQAAIINFTIRNQQCVNCEASYAQGAWHAVVQVRQRVSHKRTFFFLEQILLKHNAHSECIKIVTFRDGMDFYFSEKQHAMRFIDFLTCNIPLKTKYSRKLVSADHSNNTGNFKHNFIIEIAPICKDDLVILPKELARNLSDINPMVLVKSIAAGIHIIDPFTSERQELSTEKYWRYTFNSVMTSRDLIPYIVLSIEPILSQERPSARKRHHSHKLRLAECVVAKESDFGVNDQQYHCITHLGSILKEGHTVLGYDLKTAAWVDDEIHTKSIKNSLPDVILVRKYLGSRGERKWALRNLDVDEQQQNSKDISIEEAEREQFLQELEVDKEMRANINLYHNMNKKTVKTKSTPNIQDADHHHNNNEEDDEDNESNEDDIQLDELLDDMTLTDPTNLEHSNTISVSTTRLLTIEEASSVPGIELLLTNNEFEYNYDPSVFKFT